MQPSKRLGAHHIAEHGCLHAVIPHELLRKLDEKPVLLHLVTIIRDDLVFRDVDLVDGRVPSDLAEAEPGLLYEDGGAFELVFQPKLLAGKFVLWPIHGLTLCAAIPRGGICFTTAAASFGRWFAAGRACGSRCRCHRGR